MCWLLLGMSGGRGVSSFVISTVFLSGMQVRARTVGWLSHFAGNGVGLVDCGLAFRLCVVAGGLLGLRDG